MENLTPTQRSIVQAAADDPDATSEALAEHAGCSTSYANVVRNDYAQLIGAQRTTLTDGGEESFDIALPASYMWSVVRNCPKEVSQEVFRQVR